MLNFLDVWGGQNLRLFLGNIIAGMFGFEGKEYYTAETTETPVLGEGKLP
jgi:hypothetical protein